MPSESLRSNNTLCPIPEMLLNVTYASAPDIIMTKAQRLCQVLYAKPVWLVVSVVSQIELETFGNPVEPSKTAMFFRRLKMIKIISPIRCF